METCYSDVVRRWVLTLLDFCFEYEGKKYNYPTLIFMQISNEMSVMWQASRRGYRLNQWAECRNYYLAYENTLQTAALEVMAEKQVATSAIQGKFSSEGLAAMAKGVDTRTRLATALAANDMSNRETLENMFDALNAQNNTSDDAYDDYVPAQTYYELVGQTECEENDIGKDSFNLFDLSLFENNGDNDSQIQMDSESDVQPSTIMDMETIDLSSQSSDDEPDSFFENFFVSLTGSEVYNPNIVEPEKKKKKKKTEQEDAIGQLSFFDGMAM